MLPLARIRLSVMPGHPCTITRLAISLGLKIIFILLLQLWQCGRVRLALNSQKNVEN